MKTFMFTLTILVSLLLAACGNYSGAASSPATYTIGGTVSGLSGAGLVLQDSGGNNLSVSAGATSFTFTTAIAGGGAFNVTVFSQPSNPAQTCGVTAGASGTVAIANVTGVVVTCTTNTYTIGGTVLGLSGAGLVLQNNGGNNLSVTTNGSFMFTTAIASGSTFTVTVFSQPSHPCMVTAGASGTVASGNVTSVVVTCIDFVGTGSMNSFRDGYTATLLNNGKVLVAGGYDNNGNVLASAELYDPATGTFTATGNMTSIRALHTATLLNNGQVLVAGGTWGLSSWASAELYDPAAGTFTATGSMNSVRVYHTATLLNNGKVLVAGGQDNTENPLASAELYDPATGTFTVTGSMNNARVFHTAMLLNNGTVLVTGGEQGGGALASAELYDPATGTFTATGSMTSARVGPAATLLNNGKVLVTGGEQGAFGNTVLASAELYDPTTGTFTGTGSMASARTNHTATLLNNGQVLVAGGYNSTALLASAELYDPAAGTFTATGTMGAARGGHTATLLNNGQVLVAGGYDDTNTALASAELYLPGTLTPTGLVSITVTPTTPTVSVGSAQQFIATGTFSNGSMQILQSVTWSSSNQAAGTITNDASDHGVALALAAGQSTITASAGSISGSTVLTVQ